MTTLAHAIGLLRLRPFDTDSEEGRKRERLRRAGLSIAANICSRALLLLSMVIGVAVTVPYLGPERVGVWMTISSLAAMLSFLDLGVGNALTNRVAHVAATEDPRVLSASVSAALKVLMLLSAGIGGGLLVVATLIPWNLFIKASDPNLHAEIRNAGITFAALFGASIFGGGLQRIFHGLQRAYVVHAFSAAGALASALAVWLASRQQASVPILLLCTVGVQLLSSLLLVGVLRRERLLGGGTDRETLRREWTHLRSAGGLFLVIQVATVVSWGADNMIIAGTMGAAEVAEFGIVLRLFLLVSQPLSILNAPLWGAYADAHARKDTRFIRQILRKSVTITAALGSVLTLAVFLSAHVLATHWTSHAIVPARHLVAIVAVWTLAEAIGSAFAMFLNGCSVLRPQMALALILIVTVLPTKIYMASHFGTVALVGSSLLLYLVMHLLLYGVVFRKQIAREWR